MKAQCVPVVQPYTPTAHAYRCTKNRTHGMFCLYHFARLQERLAKHGMRANRRLITEKQIASLSHEHADD
jgi:hypothetical protein